MTQHFELQNYPKLSPKNVFSLIEFDHFDEQAHSFNLQSTYKSTCTDLPLISMKILLAIA